MKTLMIDMDNCIVDANFISTINAYLKTDYKLEEQKDYFLQNLIPEELKEGYWKFVEKDTFYKDAPLIEGAYEALEKLNKKYNLYIFTSYLYPESKPDIGGNNLRNKYEYLKKTLPFISPKQYVFIENKSLIKADIAIDDRLKNLSCAKTKLLFDGWHNRDISNKELEEKNVVRVCSWKEIEKILNV